MNIAALNTLIAACLLTVASCKPAPSPSSGVAVWGPSSYWSLPEKAGEEPRGGFDQGSMFMGLRVVAKGQQPVFMIWVDEAGGGQFAGTTDIFPERGQRFDGTVAGVPFTCLNPEQKPGTLKLGADSFQLERGGLFLISKSGPSLRIKQMSLTKLNLPTGENFSASKLNSEYFRGLARTDLDIQAFWNESSSPK